MQLKALIPAVRDGPSKLLQKASLVPTVGHRDVDTAAIHASPAGSLPEDTPIGTLYSPRRLRPPLLIRDPASIAQVPALTALQGALLMYASSIDVDPHAGSSIAIREHAAATEAEDSAVAGPCKPPELIARSLGAGRAAGSRWVAREGRAGAMHPCMDGGRPSAGRPGRASLSPPAPSCAGIRNPRPCPPVVQPSERGDLQATGGEAAATGPAQSSSPPFLDDPGSPLPSSRGGAPPKLLQPRLQARRRRPPAARLAASQEAS